LKIFKTLGLKTKTKTLLFVLEAPRDQDFGLEDYITERNKKAAELQIPYPNLETSNT